MWEGGIVPVNISIQILNRQTKCGLIHQLIIIIILGKNIMGYGK